MLSTRIRLSVVPVLVLVMSLLYPRGVLAAIGIVTDLGDNGAPGQLRFEITAAASGDTIVIPAGTIMLTGSADEDANASGEPDILKETGLLRGRNKDPVSGHHLPLG